MTSIQAIILGLVQGLTEFLPVSSSGHLVVGQHLFGIPHPELLFDVAVHLGTLIAVCIYFIRDIGKISAAMLNWPFSRTMTPEIRLGLLIIVGSIPTAFIGLFLKERAEMLFSSVALVGFMLIGTGFWMWFTRRTKSSRDIEGFSMVSALLVGTAQGLAVIPGISRSGATIAAGLYLGINRETAARFSFLLSIPAILGATLISWRDFSATATTPITTILMGAAAAALIGYAALSFLVFLVKKGNLYIFAPYCWILGSICLAMAYFG